MGGGGGLETLFGGGGANGQAPDFGQMISVARTILNAMDQNGGIGGQAGVGFGANAGGFGAGASVDTNALARMRQMRQRG